MWSRCRAQIKMQMSPAWPPTIWLPNPILNQIIFSYGTFNPLLFYSLAVPRIYCGSGGLAVSNLGHFPERNTHSHLDPIRARRGERMPISSFWQRFTVNSGAPSPPEFLVVFIRVRARTGVLATPSLPAFIKSGTACTGASFKSVFWQRWR